MAAHWQTARFRIDLQRPQVMGIVNVTPDSFSDGGRHADRRSAIAHCERLIRDGADILDIGGESTRPGAEPVPLAQELERVLPVLRAAVSLGVPVSVDTYKPQVMRAALDVGVDIVNDVHALGHPGAVDSVAAHPAAGVCLMHMKGRPQTMQTQPAYDDVVEEVLAFFRERITTLRAVGVGAERLVIDPGVGFGKSVEHNVALLARQREFDVLGRPILLGWSRKSTLGALTGKPVGERLAGSLAAALAGVQRGARIVRVHDVAETVDALKVWAAAGLVDGYRPEVAA